MGAFRQAEIEGGPRLWNRFGPNAPPMAGDDAPDGGQTNPGACDLRR